MSTFYPEIDGRSHGNSYQDTKIMNLTGAGASDYVHGCVCAFVTLCLWACVCVCACTRTCIWISKICVYVFVWYTYVLVYACCHLMKFLFYSAVALRMSNNLCKSGKQ